MHKAKVGVFLFWTLCLVLLCSALKGAFLLVSRGVTVVHVAPPKIADATYVFAGQSKRPIPVIDLRAKSDSGKITCSVPNNIGAPTFWDPGEKVTKSDCDWYTKKFINKKEVRGAYSASARVLSREPGRFFIV
jgi:hypothetical protein